MTGARGVDPRAREEGTRGGDGGGGSDGSVGIRNGDARVDDACARGHMVEGAGDDGALVNPACPSG